MKKRERRGEEALEKEDNRKREDPQIGMVHASSRRIQINSHVLHDDPAMGTSIYRDSEDIKQEALDRSRILFVPCQHHF